SDTLEAGADLCDAAAVRVLVDEGPRRVHELIAFGAVFDLDAVGELALAREGGHSEPRIVHAGGAATGAEVERALVAAARATAAQVHEHTFALDLLVEDGRCRGVLALSPDGRPVEVRARHTLLATGGAGQIFFVTTNPNEATGDGIAMAHRAGAVLADVEFIQFHPTALHHPKMPKPLLSEALRGHGALLRDVEGERFVDELLPRDQVSRAMTATMIEQGVDHLWLDATVLEDFEIRFPTIAASLSEVGLDPAEDWLPIAPAAHYTCGGMVTDLDGASTIPGLWGAGEVTCTGVHGANRLASNSLLEGMVFGPRVVEAIERGKDGPESTGAMRSVLGTDAKGVICGEAVPERQTVESVPVDSGDPAVVRADLQRAMTFGAGVRRDAASLALAAATVAGVQARAEEAEGVAWAEVRNLADVSAAIVAAAMAREETRGAHTREDFPATDPDLRVRFLHGTATPTLHRR
ncbi:MAG TPA: FAD-binding protein, partial [Acidimicrobiales bacterium]|nr:FAD-binding protein [Acidimicrobiales bacterium]